MNPSDAVGICIEGYRMLLKEQVLCAHSPSLYCYATHIIGFMAINRRCCAPYKPGFAVMVYTPTLHLMNRVIVLFRHRWYAVCC